MKTNKNTNADLENINIIFWGLPLEIASSRLLTGNEKLIYSAILGFHENKRECYLSNSVLGKILNISDNRVSIAIRKMAKLGFISYKVLSENGRFKRIIKIEQLSLNGDISLNDTIPKRIDDISLNGASTIPKRIKPISLNGDIIYNSKIEKKVELNVELAETSVSAPKKPKPKPKNPKKLKTLFDLQTSISKADYQKILYDADLANGNREYLKQVCQEMEDWSKSNDNRKIDWGATLRNWIRRDKKTNKRNFNKPLSKQIEKEMGLVNMYQKFEQEELIEKQKIKV